MSTDFSTMLSIFFVIGFILVAYTMLSCTEDYGSSSLPTDGELRILPIARNRVLVIYTGGTIGMRASDEGNIPDPSGVRDLYTGITSRTSDLPLSDFDLVTLAPVIDSSDARIDTWNNIATALFSQYEKYDAFIVLHGTDTMAYSASALSFMFENLSKPIIFTGSQVPIRLTKSDAKTNAISALIAASYLDITEVLIIFGNKILRGNRSSKTSSTSLSAFSSPNFPILAQWGYEVIPQVNEAYMFMDGDSFYPAHNRPTTLTSFSTDIQVITITVAPSTDFDPFSKMLETGRYHVCILRTFGIGNGPISDVSFTTLLLTMQKHDVVVIDLPQPTQGRTDMNDYQTGEALRKYGVVSGSDMTYEAVYTKAIYLLSLPGVSRANARDYFDISLRGELSVSTNYFDI